MRSNRSRRRTTGVDSIRTTSTQTSLLRFFNVSTSSPRPLQFPANTHSTLTHLPDNSSNNRLTTNSSFWQLNILQFINTSSTPPTSAYCTPPGAPLKGTLLIAPREPVSPCRLLFQEDPLPMSKTAPAPQLPLVQTKITSFFLPPRLPPARPYTTKCVPVMAPTFLCFLSSNGAVI